MAFVNDYENAAVAAAYSTLEFANTYHLAFRDLPAVYEKYSGEGNRSALDFGCGTGRSTRFLRRLGFNTTGLDISPQMLAKAREIDPTGDYRLLPGDDMTGLPKSGFSLIQSAFTFDNIAGFGTKVRLFSDLRKLLAAEGVIVNIVSSPEVYRHEWASFSTKAFLPENIKAQSGGPVRITTTDFATVPPTTDILWTNKSWCEVYAEAGLEIADVLMPLATGDEPFPWISETHIAPWVIYVLKSKSS